MNNTARIKIGLLGGRSYGKTVFLTKLISLADANTDGFLQFDAGSEALQIKNAMLENEGRLPATTIKEISKYNFILGKQSGEKWRVQFCDYAGELLERIDVKPSSTSENEDQNEFVANDANTTYIKKIKKWLKSCDACIVLMPEDITNKSLYPPSEVNIFKQNIGVILKVMQDDPILRKRPVCLAINKWDLTENKIPFEEFIKQEPFASFKQQLVNLCGDSLFCLPISAFGKHDINDPTKADPTGKPFQVSEMLISLAAKAELARVSAVCHAVKHLPQWVGWPLIPFILLTNTMRGITCERLKRLNILFWKKYGVRFAINGLITMVCLALTISCVCILHLGIELFDLQRQLDNGFNSPEQVAAVEQKLYRHKTFNFVFGYQWGKLRTLEALRTQCLDAKKQYNNAVIKDVESIVNARKSQFNDTNLAPSIREQRIQEIETAIANARKKLTTDSTLFSRLDSLARTIDTVKKRLKENKPFDEAYQAWLNISDEYEKARAAIPFLKEFTVAKFPERKTCIENVISTQKSIEEKKYNDLISALHRDIYKDDFGLETDLYSERIRRAEARISEIEQEIEKLPHSCRKDDYIKLKKEEEDRISYLKVYGPFDVDVERLLATSQKGSIKKINDFITQKRRDFEDKRGASFEKLEQHIDRLNESFYNELLRTLNTPQYAHDINADYKKQIELAESRIEIIKQFIPEFSKKLYISKCEELIVSAQKIKKERELYGPFEVAYAKLLRTPDENKIRAIETFIANYPEDQYPEKKQIFAELKNMKQALSNEFYKKLLESLPKRKANAKWKEQKKISEDRILFIRKKQESFSQTSEQWTSCKTLIEEEQKYIAELKYNGKFDDAYDVLIRKTQDKTFIREILNFTITYNETTFPARKNIVEELRKQMQTLETQLFKNLHQIDLGKAKSWQDKHTLLTSRIEKINKEIVYFTDDSPYRNELQSDIQNFSSEAKRIERYGCFDDQLNLHNRNISGKTTAEKIKLLDAFLQRYNTEMFPERSEILTKLRSQLMEFDQEIRKEAFKELESSNYSDNEQLRWDVKIQRAEARIRILQNGLANFSATAPYRDEFAKRIASDHMLIKNSRAYEVYYKEYTIVENKSSFYKILAINEFIRKFKGQYPAPLSRYTIERLIKQKEELLNKFNEDLTQALKNNEDNAKLTWKERLNRARSQKEALLIFQNATGLSKETEIERADHLISRCNENIAFEDAYAFVCREFDNPYDMFFAIYDFYDRYPVRKWEKERKNEFAVLEKRIKDVSRNIMVLLDNELKKLPDAKSLSEAESILLKKIGLYEEYRKKYLTRMPEYKNLSEKLATTQNELRGIADAKLAKSKIQALLSEGASLSQAAPEQVGIFLIGISAFVKTYPEKNVHKFVLKDYHSLLNLRDSWNARLYDQMRSELKPFDDSLKNELSDDEKNAVYDQILRIREKYLALFSVESNQYDLVKREYDNSYKSQSQLKKEREIKAALDDLRRILQDETISTANKLLKITTFEKQLAAHGKREQFPRFRSEFEYVDEMQQILTWDHAFEELNGRISHLLQNQPSGDNEAKTREFVLNCKKLQRDLERFIANPRTENKAMGIKISLEKKIGECEKILNEWECYRTVKVAHSDFIKNPSDTTYKAFEDSVWKLQRHEHQNHNHQTEIAKLRERNKEINNVRQELDRQFHAFRSQRNAARLNSLCQTAIKYMNLGQKNKVTEYIMRLSCASFEPKSHTWIYTPQPLGFDIMLQTFNFSSSGFQSSWGIDVDLFVQVTGAGTYIVFDVDDISDRNKNNPSHAFLVRRLGEAGIRRRGYTSIQNTITTEFKNDNCRDDVGSESVEFAYILAKAMDSGECDIDFVSTSSRRPEAGRGYVRIKFTGLPRY